MRKSLLLTGLLGLIITTSVHADLVRLLPKNEDALQARADLIQQAKKEIRVEYFIMTDDPVATGGLALLRQAAQRGVKVKIMIDGIFNSVKPETLATLLYDSKDAQGNQNIEIRLFKPMNLLKPTGYLHRDHTKMLNIDGQIMITGGRNIEDAYFGLDKKRNFRDLDILVSGKVVDDAKNYYDQLWNRKTDVKIPLLKYFTQESLDKPCPTVDDNMHCPEKKARLIKKLFTAHQQLAGLLTDMNAGRAAVRLNTGTNWLENVQNFDNVRLLNDDPNKPVGAENQVVSDELLKLVMTAKKSITILTPYLVPTKGVMQAFKALIARGIKITIVTNSLRSTDNLLAYAGYKSSKQALIDLGVELYEFNLTDTLHAKSAIIDGHILLVGTYNLDPRSSRINREIMLEVNDEENSVIGAELTAIMENFKSQSLLVGKDGKEQNITLQNQSVSNTRMRTVKLLMKALPLYRNQL